MSAAARGAAGWVSLMDLQAGRSERLPLMQRDMDRIAAGELPRTSTGRNATASDIEAYRARISTAAKAA